MDFPQGSIWRKWDLQVQTRLDDNYSCLGGSTLTQEQIEALIKETGLTKAEIESQEKTIAPEKYAKLLVKYLELFTDISAIALTDHNRGDEIDPIIAEAEQLNRVFVFPGVEVSSTQGIHILCLFDRNKKWRNTWKECIDHFLTEIELTGSRFVANKPASSPLPAQKILEVVEAKGGLCIFAHIGNENGLLYNQSSTANGGTAHIDIYTHSLCNIVQIPSNGALRTGAQNIINGLEPAYQNKKTIQIKCSDARKITDIGKSYAWIKADPTLYGLKQVIRDPQRVSLEDRPKKLVLIQKDKSKYIKQISVHKEKESKIDDVWFDNDIELNPGLVAVIGNKGGGKSALTEAIALLGCSKNYEYFSFLKIDRFRKNHLAGNFYGKIVWEDGVDSTVNLDKNPKDFEFERVKCIPQNYIELLCNELDNKFQDEINSVVFSHIEDGRKLGKKVLKDLIDYRTQIIDKNINEKQLEIQRINKELVDLENKQSESYKKSLEDRYKLANEEITNHFSNRPKTVQKPSVNTQQESTNKASYEKIAEIEKKIKVLEADLIDKEKSVKELNSKIESLELVKAELQLLKSRYDSLKESHEEALKKLLNIDFKAVADLMVNTTLIEEKLNLWRTDKNKFSEMIADFPSEGEEENNLSLKIGELKKERRTIQNALDEPSKKYELYQSAYKDWKKSLRLKIKQRGALKREIRYLGEVLGKDIHNKREDRKGIVNQIYLLLGKKIEIYSDLYKPVIKFVEGEKSKGKTKEFLSFSIEIIPNLFVSQFFTFIDRGKKGSFQGVNESADLLKEIIQKYDFSNFDQVMAFVNEIIKNLNDEIDGSKSVPRVLEDQLLKGKTKIDLYNFLFSFGFLSIDYRLKFGDKHLNELSPGEKGSLLLIFYLLIDRDNIPLIIDQPEGNLDNESVFHLLVPYIKEAKERRQVILVTHNPNLAVVCDAEQIIYSEIHKNDKNRVKYILGSLENDTIRAKVVDVLEGTKPAFVNRQETYSFK